jgi:hypothetical protein
MHVLENRHLPALERIHNLAGVEKPFSEIFLTQSNNNAAIAELNAHVLQVGQINRLDAFRKPWLGCIERPHQVAVHLQPLSVFALSALVSVGGKANCQDRRFAINLRIVCRNHNAFFIKPDKVAPLCHLSKNKPFAFFHHDPQSVWQDANHTHPPYLRQAF